MAMAPHALTMIGFLVVGIFLMTSRSGAATAPPATFTVDLFHRFQPSSRLRPPNATDADLLHMLLQRDSARADAISRSAQLYPNTSPAEMNLAAGNNNNTTPQPPFTEFVGISELQYFVTLRLGDSSGHMQELAFIMDVTSDLTWLQCQPCTFCMRQKDPIYQPWESNSFHHMSCQSFPCQQLPDDIRTCSRNNNACGYHIDHKDGTEIEGLLGLETVGFGTWEQPRVPLGCNEVTKAYSLEGAAGIFALGTGPLSFTTVFASRFHNIFSYCLPGFFSHTPGYLTFGGSMTNKSAMSIIRSPISPSQYFVPLRKIYFNGSLINLPEDLFDIDPSTGRGGVMLDTSSTVTRLIPHAYYTLGVLIKSALSSIGFTVFSSKGYDYCINLGDIHLEDVPGMPYIEFEFAGGAILPLHLHNLFIQNAPEQTMCIAIVSARDGPYSVIGTTQQRGSEWSFNLWDNQISLLPNQC